MGVSHWRGLDYSLQAWVPLLSLKLFLLGPIVYYNAVAEYNVASNVYTDI